MLKRSFKFILRSVLIFIGFVILYVVAAFVLPPITVNNSYTDTPDGIKIFVLSNGVHTDIVVPFKNEYKDWTVTFPPDSFDVKGNEYSYIGFGWGDKGFYMEAPTWNDLTASTFLKASFGLSGTAMHVRYFKERMKETKCCEIFTISSSQYLQLTHFIEESFKKENSNVLKINHPGYGELDRFYEANGKYSLFTTCNCWTNEGLKRLGIKTACWSPFAAGLMSSLKH